MKPLVSIIIPAYNAEKTIEKCLNSVLNQSYEEIEVIVINDGSTDNTKEILKKYELSDSRIILITVKNGGVSAARNLGLKVAKGQFLQFVDADDWISDNATESLIFSISHDCDMVISDYTRVLEKHEIVRGDIKKNGIISRADYALEMMKAPSNYYYGVLWNKLYKTEIIRENNLNFSRKINWCEDFQFNLEYLEYAKNIYVLQNPIYYYVKVKGSLSSMSNVVKDVVSMKLSLFERYKALYESIDLYEENKIKIRRFYVDFARDNAKSFKYTKTKKQSSHIKKYRLKIKKIFDERRDIDE